jgi:endonuclease YncB( thermonuclease family)
MEKHFKLTKTGLYKLNMNSAQKLDRLIRLTLTLLWLVSLSACAEDVYRWQDKDGGLHYGGRAVNNANKLNIRAGYSYFRVTNVYDGDTVKLENGRKIRLLNINTPEVRHRNQVTEAGGEQAKRWLKNKLQGKKVRLVMDAEPVDKYKRTLAHLFTEEKDHINLQLIEQGLASVNIYPPNLKFADELAVAESRAEQAGRGIWSKPEYASIAVDDLDADGHAGWLRLRGKVNVIRSSRKYVYLEFSKMFQARIEKRWLPLFPDTNTYLGKTVEVRGWLNKNRKGWSMLIRHPTAIKVLS